MCPLIEYSFCGIASWIYWQWNAAWILNQKLTRYRILIWIIPCLWWWQPGMAILHPVTIDGRPWYIKMDNSTMLMIVLVHRRELFQ
ncbi:hypothetical protein BC941DRAFT_237509 [Chlamydoabsidia padenii]|nr:hypothetical protein BC941DRAFT_237509 [Chlamydoabsidia padenii]